MNRLRTYSVHARRFARDERGSPAVEFAMIAPVLMLLVLGIVQFGFLFYTYNEMMNGAREGARRLAVGATPESAILRADRTMALNRPYEFYPVPGNPAVTMTIKLKVSDAMIITNLDRLFPFFGIQPDWQGTFYPKHLSASVTMHRE